MDLFVFEKFMFLHACAEEWTLLLLNFILNEKNYFDSKHSMQVQRLFSCRCKKRFSSMWMQLVFDEVWLYCKHITEHQLFV